MGGSDPPPERESKPQFGKGEIELNFRSSQKTPPERISISSQRLKIKLPFFHVSMEMYTHTRNIRCIFGVKITRVEAQQGQRPVRLWGERKRIAKSREREREREGERSPLSRVCRGLRAVSGSGEGGGAAGEGRRASRRRLPHPAKRLLPLNRQNVYLTQPWRRRRRERASLPRHAVARRARFRCFHFSLPFRNPPRTASASVSAKVSPTIPPCVYYTRENQLFLPSPLLRVCVRKYIYMYVYAYLCA